MIYIKRNQSNKILRRFLDRANNCDSYFLWKIIDKENNTDFLFITPDISQSNQSFNLFDFVHDDNQNLNVGGIAVPLNLKSGHYNYEVYETSEYSLDENKIIKLIEKDILFVELVYTENTNISNDVYR